MSLLREIQKAAVDSSSRITDLLRKCRVLAGRLGNDEFKEWVDRELEGYPPDAGLPAYRTHEVQSLGTFFMAGGTMKNVPIPPGSLPQEARDLASHADVFMSVGEVAELLERTQGEGMHQPWPADAVALISRTLFRGTMVEAWRVLPRSALVGIVEAVRNRVLRFAADLEADWPEAGESGPNPPPEHVTHVFHNTHVAGNVGNLASGSCNFTQTAVSVAEGDFAGLASRLVELGLTPQDITDLTEALVADEKEKGRKSLGSRTWSWIGRMTGKAAEGALKIGSSVATEVLEKAIRSYLGV